MNEATQLHIIYIKGKKSLSQLHNIPKIYPQINTQTVAWQPFYR